MHLARRAYLAQYMLVLHLIVARFPLLFTISYRQVNGALGCLSRLPIPQEVFRLGHRQPTAETSELSEEQPAEHSFSRWSRDLWNPYLRKTALRVFASCGLSAQVFQGPVSTSTPSRDFRDIFTAVSCISVSLPLPETGGCALSSEQAAQQECMHACQLSTSQQEE